MEVLTRPTADPDGIAAGLSRLAEMGRALPPAWDGARISTPVIGPQGEGVGRILPGRGLYLDMDLAALGIQKPVPHVFERSTVRRWLERVAGWDRDPQWRERGFIRGIRDIRQNLAAGLGQEVMEVGTATWRSGFWAPSFRDFGGSYAAIPGGSAFDRSSAGAISGNLTNPISGNKKYLISFGIQSSRLMRAMILADLLVAAGSISSATNSPQTINSTALTRYTNGKGVLVTFDNTGTSGSGAANLTMTKYTNQDGTQNQVSQAVAMVPSAIGPELAPDRTFPIMKLATGDYGVRSVEEITFSASMGGAGTVALNLFYPLLYMPIMGANYYSERDATAHAEGLTELAQTASGVLGCLIIYTMGDATSTSALKVRLRTVEG